MKTSAASAVPAVETPSPITVKNWLDEARSQFRSDMARSASLIADAESAARAALAMAGYTGFTPETDWSRLPREWVVMLGRALRSRLSVHALRSDQNEAAAARAEAESVLLYLKDDAELGAFYSALGILAYDRSEYAESLRQYSTALPYAKRLADGYLTATILQNEGNVWSELGEYARAIDGYTEAAKAAENSKDASAGLIRASILMNLAAVYQDYKQLETARDFFCKALTACDLSNFPILHSKIVAGLGTNEKLCGNYSAARQRLNEALRLKRRGGDRAGAPFCGFQLALCARKCGDYTAAAEYLDHAEAEAREIDHKRWLTQVLIERGRLLATEEWSGHDPAGARKAYEAAIECSRAINYRDSAAHAHEALADLHEKSGNPAAALQALREANAHRLAFHEAEAERKLASLRALHEVEAAREETARERARNRKLEHLLEEKDAFLSIAAHDLKNPLSALITLVRSMQEEPSLSEETAIGLREIEGSVSHMFAIVSNLLDLSRYESGDVAPELADCELSSVLYFAAEALLPVAQRKNIEVSFSFPAEDIPYRADFTMLRQIVDNLVSNALKFSPPETTVQVSLSQHGNSWRFAVNDEGPGIDAAEQQKLFKRFSRTTNRPTAGEHSSGLGLAIVKRLADLHGASVGVRSTPGKGSVFFVDFPR
ncbi:MAG: hypothetical protein JJU00_10640 [Opitutales bacterium]|nr:hypothetical protein [Opitutales bacterium]